MEMRLAALGLAVLACVLLRVPARGEDVPPTPTPSTAAETDRSTGGARPSLVVAEPSRDLGEIVPGEKAVAEFRVENRGAKPVALEAGRPDPLVPGVRVEVAGSPVAPGEAATVSVALDTERLSGPGAFRVPVTSDDPEAPRIALSVRATVRPLLAADPGFARWVTVQQEREGTIAQTIWSRDGATFRVLAVESPLPALRVTSHEARDAERRADAAGSQWRVETTLASDAPVGALTGYLVVTTDHPRQKRLRIPVSGFVRPIFAVTPPVADVGAVDPSRRLRFTLNVKSFASEDIAIESAESTVPGVELDVVPVEAGRVYDVRLTVGPEVAAGPIDGTIRILTASPKQRTIEVPLRGRAVVAGAPAQRD